MTRIYSTAPVPAIAEQAFAALGPIQVLDDAWSELDRAEVLLVRAEALDAVAIGRATSLRLIARTGAGVDQVDVVAATRRGVPVLYVPSAGERPVAEGTIALILAAMKRLGELRDVLLAGTWPRRYEVDILDISEATLGIVGYGRIGREVARLAMALGMKVIAYDPEPRDSGEGVELLELDDLLQNSDVVSVHCPLTEATRDLIDAAAIARMKSGAIFVNVARGQVVADEQLLVDALESGHLSAIALDVFANEPPLTTNFLLNDPRALCTPHSIGLTSHWNQRTFRSLAADSERFLRGELPSHVVNPAVLDQAVSERA